MTSAKHPRVRLQHILENINGVQEATAGLPIDTILDNYMLLRMTERAFQIISEAAKELPPEVRDLEPHIPWRNIIGMGNFLRHEYYRLDPEVLDLTLTTELPALRLAVLRLMAQLPE